MEVVRARTVWIIEMGYEVDTHILESYANILLDAPSEPTQKIFGNFETIKSSDTMQKQKKKRDKVIKHASKFVEVVKKGLLKLDLMKGVVEQERKSQQQPVAHISPMATSSDPDNDKVVEFKRVEREKRKPSPAPAPSPNKSRTPRQKQQVV